MEHDVDVPGLLRAHSNRWPDSSWANAAGNLALRVEERFQMVLSGQEVLWGDGGSVESRDRVQLSAVVCTRDFIVREELAASVGQGTPAEGATEILPWSVLESITLSQWVPPTLTRDHSTCAFTLHLGAHGSLDVTPSRPEGAAAVLELFAFARDQLAGLRPGRG